MLCIPVICPRISPGSTCVAMAHPGLNRKLDPQALANRESPAGIQEISMQPSETMNNLL